MSDRSCIVSDGTVVIEGAHVRLVQARGVGERTILGVARCFDQDGELRWEVATDDPQWPAIGFLPEHVSTAR